MSVSESDRVIIEDLLGREPRGLQAVAVRDNDGVPMVVRVASLVDDKPFPTMFWLIDKRINYAIDQVEGRGLIASFQAQIDDSDTLKEQMIADHQAYIALRLSFMSTAEQAKMQSLGFEKVSSSRGIGGIADFQRVRCLHTYYAAHLVTPNTVGKLLDAHWQQMGISFAHFS